MYRIGEITLIPHFWSRDFFFARSIKLFGCWGTLESFEHGWSYRKNSNACKFVLTYQLIHKIFRLGWGPVFCLVSGFCTSDGPIEKITMQATLYSHTGSSIKKLCRHISSFGIKFSRWSGVWFSVRFPVFALRMRW